MKKIINKIFFKLIELIENKQYKNLKLDQNEPLKKITNITFVDKEDIYVDSPNGWVKVDEINETQPYRIHYIKTNKGKELFCADDHMLYDDNDNIVYVQNLKENDIIQTIDGIEYINEIYSYNSSNSMVDLSVDSNEMNYYANEILSHNTITAAIALLHYCIFNKNKGCMIVANKGDTVIEIVDKIKNIYKLLPFFLKPGIVNWNNKNIAFDNGCRIKSQARSKEPAIGFTIDFLYMDEFAHIPRNIIGPYYKAAIPTVSSMNDSKIVITSTPNGANLFKDLVLGAALPPGHPDKNMYKLIKVLWHQVPHGSFDDGTKGTRMDAKIFELPFETKKSGYTIEDLNDELKNEYGFKTLLTTMKSDTGDKKYIQILHKQGVSDIDTVRTLKLKNNAKPIVHFFSITNWKEQEIKLIGGEEGFNQEYNIQFVAGSKRVLSASKAKDLEERSTKYETARIDEFDEVLPFDYSQLRFAPDFIPKERNNYYWVSSLDVSEGLGQDDSAMTFFRLMVRSDEWLKENKIKTFKDAFYLKQSMTYNFNLIDHKTELCDLFYLLHFKYLNPNKVKSIVEVNGPGNTFLASMSKAFDGNNNYGTYIHVKYKHTLSAVRKKIGIKITRNKKELVKDYIKNIESDKLYVDEDLTLDQMDNFIKIETAAGNITYRADAGHDDIVMTLVNASTFFETLDYEVMCKKLYKELSQQKQKLIDDAMDLSYNPNGHSYKKLSKAVNNGRRGNSGRKSRFRR